MGTRAWWAWGLGACLGCASTDAFLCESDEGCQQGGVHGLCQPSGYCSFPDDACASGQRYGEHASGTLAGTCVEPGGEVGTTELAQASTSTTGPSTLTAMPDVDVDVDDGASTTSPVDPPQTSTSTGDGMVGEEVGTTGTAQLVCWTDEFDDGRIGPQWCPWADAGVAIDEPRGHLRFSLVPAEWGMGSSSGSLPVCEPFPLLGAHAAAELVAVPDVSTYTEAYVELGTEELRVALSVLDGDLYVFVTDAGRYSNYAWQPYEPDAHRWLRVIGTEDGLVAEHSADGMAWVHVYTLPVELVGMYGTARMAVWGEMVPLGPDDAQFERFELCALQG